MKDDVGQVTEWRLSDTRKFITVACALYAYRRGPSPLPLACTTLRQAEIPLERQPATAASSGCEIRSGASYRGLLSSVQSTLSFVQLAEPRANVALNAVIVELVPVFCREG